MSGTAAHYYLPIQVQISVGFEGDFRLMERMMNNEKYKSKVRKLLALATSDNPHEAERARVQAEKLIAKHSIDPDSLEVVTLDAKPVRRKKMKQYELDLIESITTISGCHAFVYSKKAPNASYTRLVNSACPRFIGAKSDAELAVYAWDVLTLQMRSYQRRMKSENPELRVAQFDALLSGWVYAASKKLVNVFGNRKPNEAASREYKAKCVGKNFAKPIMSKFDMDDHGIAMAILGYKAGHNVQLNAAARDQREPVHKIEHADHDQ